MDGNKLPAVQPNQCRSTLERNVGFMQELSMMLWMMQGDAAKPAVEATTGLQVLLEVWNRITNENEITFFREVTLLAIADFVKKNPHASEAVIQAEVARQIELFASRISSL